MMKLPNLLLVSSLVCLLMAGCPQPAPSGGGTTDGDGSDGSGTTDGTGTDGTDTGDVSDSALNFAGTASGTVSTTSTTAGGSAESGRKLAPFAISGTATVWLTDLNGNPLLDAEGNEYPAFPVNTNGTFELTGLPVGVEIVANIDVDGDGVADLYTIFSIPKDEESDTGNLEGIVADPLSTMAYGKVQQMTETAGGEDVNLEALGINFTALVEMIRIVFESLLAESGIELEIDMDLVIGKTLDALAELFDLQMPEAAQRSMQMAESNVALVNATDINSTALAIAQALVQGGFVIAVEPGSSLDFSSLAELPNVEEMTMEQFDQLMSQFQGPHISGQDAPGMWNPTVYVNLATEPDRNFGQVDNDPGFKMRPMVNDYLLMQIAQAYYDQKSITVGNFRRMLVDALNGLGLRLTYQGWMPPPEPGEPGDPFEPMPWLQTFETEDGTGIQKDMNDLHEMFESAGVFGAPHEQVRVQMRQILAQFLGGTKEPTLERLFGPLLTDRLPSADEVARYLREARAHLPFSVSGPARFYVVATADPWQDQNARPVTVNAQTDANGYVQRVAYDANGAGKFYLQFGPWEEEGGLWVHLTLRQNGKMLHDEFGFPVMLNMADDMIFAPVDGQSFHARFSESRTEYATEPRLSLPNEWFNPDLPPDPETNPPAVEMWCLVTEFGPDSQPIRVDYDDVTCVATYNADGQYYLVPGPNTWENDLFELVTADGEFALLDPNNWESHVEIDPADIVIPEGLADPPTIMPETHTWVFGKDVPNPGYDPSGAPYYDDINDDGVRSGNEPTFDYREFLWDPSDWRSTNVEIYYRRTDGTFVDGRYVRWEADTATQAGLVPRNFKPLRNAYRYGQPNTAINLLMAFSPPEFFNGTQAFNAETRLNVVQAIALLDLVLGSIQNVEAVVDWDGPEGPSPSHRELIDAWFFIPPLDDPMQMISDGFMQYLED